jgi:hypothetical protein
VAVTVKLLIVRGLLSFEPAEPATKAKAYYRPAKTRKYHRRCYRCRAPLLKPIATVVTDDDVLREACRLGYLLAGSIFLNSIQPVLSGVAIGAGWQALVAFVNIGSYCFVGIPLAALFGFKLSMDAMVKKRNSKVHSNQCV